MIYHEIREAKPQKLAYGMIVVVSYGLNPPVYIDIRGGEGYTESVTEKEIYISESPSLPSTQRRVPSGHGTKSLESCIFIVQQSVQSI